MQIKIINGGVTAPTGFVAGGIHAGIRKNANKKDLAVIYSPTICNAAAVYTLNKVKGAPLIVTAKNLADGKAQAVICNSGNANTCNTDGEQIATDMCTLLAKELNIKTTDIIIASTGVIGKRLPIEPIANALPALCKNLSAAGGDNAAEAIMTTDLTKKEIAVQFTLGGKTCTIGAIAKGSGMINPNMATMLCFIATDVNIDSKMLHKALLEAVGDSFNMISVDGDTSTNDMVSVMANGLAGNAKIVKTDDGYGCFKTALLHVCKDLGIKVAADGEGATKLLTANVVNAKSIEAARKAAKSVISSSLVKAAFFGQDANWGRILCAIGYSGAECDIDKINIGFESAGKTILVCENGKGVDFNEDYALQILKEKNIQINIDMKQGSAKAAAWGCDMTYDYVKINGSYRT